MGPALFLRGDPAEAPARDGSTRHGDGGPNPRARRRSYLRTMAVYSFVTRWFIGAPIERVYEAIHDVRHWPDWWKGVLRVDVVQPPSSGGTGQVTRCVWRSALPYRLCMDVRVMRDLAPHAIEVAATGDLVGDGVWEFAREAEGTLVTYAWNVRTTQRWMNLLAPLLRPAFAWNHAIVMRWGGEGLGRLVGARFEDRSRPS